jgi:hypothetical protein
MFSLLSAQSAENFTFLKNKIGGQVSFFIRSSISVFLVADIATAGEYWQKKTGEDKIKRLITPSEP